MEYFSIAGYFILPAVSINLAKSSKPLKALGPVVLCYLLGMLLRQIFRPGEAELEYTKYIAGVSIMVSIALMLVSTDFMAWLKLAKNTMLGMGLALISALVTTFITFGVIGTQLENGWQYAGMLVGVYTGGTANMAAIATALNVPAENFIQIHTADIIICGAYFLFLLTIAPKVYARFLGPFKSASEEGSGEYFYSRLQRGNLKGAAYETLINISLGVAIFVVSYLIAMNFDKDIENTVLIIALSVISAAASFAPRLRCLKGSHEVSDYLLLIFCVAVGSMADFENVSSISPLVYISVGVVIGGASMMHLLLCRMFKIDRDTAIITSTAAVFGPPFIGAVANEIKNRQIIPSGITSGIIGLVVGTYLGLFSAYAIKYLWF